MKFDSHLRSAFFACYLALGTAYAQEGTPPTAPVSVSEAPGGLSAVSFGVGRPTFRPSAGAIFFEGNQQPVGGLLADFDIFESQYLNIGLGSGALYSELNNSLDTYIIQVPVDLILSLFPGRSSRWSIGPHVGANVIYSSAGIGNSFGTNSFITTPGAGNGAKWNAWLDVGPEVQFALTDAIDIGIRYDSTFASVFSMQTLTLGLGFRV
jgi:hypothetical protein